MKCPYCCETIDDNAVVCPRCRRDLAFFNPLMSRLRRAEDDLEAAKVDVAELKLHARLELRPSDITPLTALVSSALLAFLFTWLDWPPFFNGVTWDRALQSLSVCSPFFPAVVLGIVVPRVRASSALLLGLVAGIAGETQMLFLYAIGRVDVPVRSVLDHKAEVYVIAVPDHWYWSFVLYVIGGAVLFLCGTLVGQWFRGGASGEALSIPPSERWLARLKIALTTIGTISVLLIPIVRGVLDALGPHKSSQ